MEYDPMINPDMPEDHKTMTDAQNKAKWIKALRSGEYKQARETLKEQFEDGSVGYCCLGVYLSAVMSVEPDSCVRNEFWDIDEGDFELYKSVKKVIPYEVWDNGVSMNDDGDTFEEIADMIEEEWKV